MTTLPQSLSVYTYMAHHRLGILRRLIIHSRERFACLLRQNNIRAWQRFQIPITRKPSSKGIFLCFSFAHPFVRRSIHKRLPCVRQKPLFNCVGVVHSFRHAYAYYTCTYNVMALFPGALLDCELYACFVLIPRRVQVHNESERLYIHYIYCKAVRSSKQLTQFHVSPNRTASSHCANFARNVVRTAKQIFILALWFRTISSKNPQRI